MKITAILLITIIGTSIAFSNSDMDPPKQEELESMTCAGKPSCKDCKQLNRGCDDAENAEQCHMDAMMSEVCIACADACEDDLEAEAHNGQGGQGAGNGPATGGQGTGNGPATGANTAVLLQEDGPADDGEGPAEGPCDRACAKCNECLEDEDADCDKPCGGKCAACDCKQACGMCEEEGDADACEMCGECKDEMGGPLGMLGDGADMLGDGVDMLGDGVMDGMDAAGDVAGGAADMAGDAAEGATDMAGGKGKKGRGEGS